MTKRRIQIAGARVLVMGLAFKENCPDLRNTRVVDIIAELKDYNCTVDVYDPWVTVEAARHEYNIIPVTEPRQSVYDVIIVAVAHRQFKAMGANVIRSFGKPGPVLYDLKYIMPVEQSDLRL